MLEIAPGIYTSPDMSKGVRERIWTVISGWYETLNRGAIVMTWHDNNATGRQGVLCRGEPPKALIDADGLLIVRKSIK